MAIITKYKFDKTIYADLLPEFNAEFTPDKYNTTDEEVDGIITRTIESDELPTLMRFGSNLTTYVEGNELALLEVLDMNTSGLTSCYRMFRHCNNLTSITCEWDTSNVTNMYTMFYGCTNLTTLDVSKFDTSKVTSMRSMFYSCTNLTLLDVSNFNTSNVTSMYCTFRGCNNLASLDVSNWNTSNVTDMYGMFNSCIKLTTLDVSNFDTSNVTDMTGMFAYCNNLTSLDVSNFDTNNVTNMTGMFSSTLNLTDIGMLYCDQFTINKVASLLPTDHNITIWVEDVDIKDLTPVGGVEFKQYAKNTEIMLTSPLLEGDKLVVHNGKLCHYHKMGMVVLDGSEIWDMSNNLDKTCRFSTVLPIDSKGTTTFTDYIGAYSVSDNFICDNNTTYNRDEECYQMGNEAKGSIYIRISKSKLTSLDTEGFKQWLQANPTTVVYELVSPYYEVISEDPLDISIISETVDITNSSNIPLNMAISNSGMSTVAMKPSTTYTVAFDKEGEEDLTVNLCGNEITTSNNIVEITTSSELGNDELIFYGDGVEVSNVRLLEGSVSGDSIPRESFEGLKNSFEDGYIPENVITKLGIIPDISQGTGITILGDNYTFPSENLAVMFSHSNFSKPHTFVVIPSNDSKTQQYTVHSIKNGNVQVYQYVSGFSTLLFNQPADRYRMYTEEPVNSTFRILILEGDWTHLTEEDFNHLGKYKVEYKVTGKNKFDINKCNFNTFDNGYAYMQTQINNKILLKKGVIYTLSYDCIVENPSNFMMNICLIPNHGLPSKTFYVSSSTGKKVCSFTPIETREYEIRIIPQNGDTVGKYYVKPDSIQLEEGAVATSYEPYKEYTKTFYLNSPLLEGDTIEDVNGVATHVKRKKEIKLNLDTYTDILTNEQLDEYNVKLVRLLISSELKGEDVYSEEEKPDTKEALIVEKANVVIRNWSNKFNKNDIYLTPDGHLWLAIDSTLASVSKEYIEENVGRIVARLASPIYETILTESILCDSYVNGHLDIDTNVPIEKVKFIHPKAFGLKYLYPNTKYTVQFKSDNVGECSIGISGVYYKFNNIVKGINKCSLTTSSNLVNRDITIHGIGFNASNIQVVATDKDIDFGYFKGLQSSFENNTENLWDGTLVKGVHISATSSTYSESISEARSACIKCRPNTTYIITATNNDRLRIGHVSELVDETICMISDIDDTNIRYKEFTTAHREGYLIVYVANESNTNENITVDIREKANKVKCKVVGKNKFNGEYEKGYIDTEKGFVSSELETYTTTWIKCKPNTTYIVKATYNGYNYIRNRWILRNNSGQETIIGGVTGNETPKITTLNDTVEFKVYFKWSGDPTDVKIIAETLQIEEGTQATEYEPHQEYTKTIYLNSPLLKGDAIEVHNGKLCHYHKMGIVVLDGSEEGWYLWDVSSAVTLTNTIAFAMPTNGKNGVNEADNSSSVLGNTICDKFIESNEVIDSEWYMTHSNIASNNRWWAICINKTKLSTHDVNGFKQWLQANPTTVVYELAEPYYEEITPTQEDLIITSVKEGDLHIDTIIPISSKVTYNVNVQLLTDFEQSIVEQVQATQTTDLQSILDEEIDN